MEIVSEKMRKVISECLIGKKNEENDLVFFQDQNNRNMISEKSSLTLKQRDNRKRSRFFFYIYAHVVIYSSVYDGYSG